MKRLIANEEIARTIIEEATDYAIFVVSVDGRVDSWNPGAEHIFGYSADEILGKELAVLFTEEDRAHGVPARELRTAREQGRAHDTRWHRRKDGRRIFCDGITTAMRNQADELTGFAKIARDITERYRAEQRLAAQLTLSNLLTQERPIQETARGIMEAICTNLGWDVGLLWDRDADGALRCLDIWQVPEIDAGTARKLCAVEALERGSGLPGLVAESREPHWVPNFAAEEKFQRAPLAAAAGLRAAVAFPIVHETRAIGVMEFFSREAREPDQALLPVMALIGGQIGDFIQRRRTASSLRESEERYRVVLETAQDAIFTIDATSTIQFCNAAVERVFGYRPAELIGRNLDVVIPERYREAHARGVINYLQTHERRIPWTGVEMIGLHRDGHEIPLSISFGEWTENGRTTFTGFARDITTQKHALEEEQTARAEAEASRAQLERRAEEESSFRHLASALTGAVEMTEVLFEITNRATLVTRADGVYVERITTPDRQVEVVSAAGRGVPRRGLRVSYPGSLTESIMRGREPVILGDMSEVGETMAPYLLETCGKCELLVAPLIAEEEPLGALVLLNSSVSGRRFGDGDVVRARTLGDLASLALRRVRLMEQEREARERAEAAVRVRDETLGIVSHDLRNPLTKISLSADLMIGASDEEQRELIETIRAAAGQAQRLIQDLLDVARVEAGRFSVHKKMIDANDIVRDACESHEPLAAQKDLKIACAVTGPLPQICADRDRLLQVFGNLIGNAIKFTPGQGTITIAAQPQNGAVLFRVQDTGTGIPEADLRNIFRPYWQAKKTAHMGAGLGLAIVRGIVEAHGGTVWAANVPGGGAEFAFTVPQG